MITPAGNFIPFSFNKTTIKFDDIKLPKCPELSCQYGGFYYNGTIFTFLMSDTLDMIMFSPNGTHRRIANTKFLTRINKGGKFVHVGHHIVVIGGFMCSDTPCKLKNCPNL